MTMISKNTFALLVFSGLGVLVSAHSYAGTAFLDDFDREHWEQDGPVTWERYPFPWGEGTITTSEGSLLVTPSPDVFPYGDNKHELDLGVAGQLYHDVDVRTTVRALGTSSFYYAGLGAADNGTADALGNAGLFGYLTDTGELVIWGAYPSHPDGGGALVSTQTGLRMSQYDVNLRLKIDGDVGYFSAWRADAAEPMEPTLTVNLPSPLDNPDHMGKVMLWAGSEGTVFPFAFREFEVVPEPSAISLLGMAVVAVLMSMRKTRRSR